MTFGGKRIGINRQLIVGNHLILVTLNPLCPQGMAYFSMEHTSMYDQEAVDIFGLLCRGKLGPSCEYPEPSRWVRVFSLCQLAAKCGGVVRVSIRGFNQPSIPTHGLVQRRTLLADQDEPPSQRTFLLKIDKIVVPAESSWGSGSVLESAIQYPLQLSSIQFGFILKW